MKKKLLYIGNNLATGNPTTLIQLGKLLKDIGFDVYTYSSKKNPFIRLMDMCLAVIKHKDAVVVVIDTYSTYNFYYALIVSQLARLLNIPYIPILHGGNLPFRLQNSPKFSKMLFSHALLNVSPSKYLQHEFEKNGFRTTCIPNGIDLLKYPFQYREFTDPTLLWVRAFDPIYNPKMAIDTLIFVRKKFPNTTLCMVGPDKGCQKEVEQYIYDNSLEKVVEITGILAKEEWIKKSVDSTVFINTSNIDNIPVSVVEAMALGLPVISTNVGGMPFLIMDGMEGVLVEKNDYKAMSNAIIKLFLASNSTKEIVKNARITAETFDNTQVTAAWQKLLNHVL